MSLQELQNFAFSLRLTLWEDDSYYYIDPFLEDVDIDSEDFGLTHFESGSLILIKDALENYRDFGAFE